MNYFKVDELQKDSIHPYNVKDFLFKLIQEEFGYGYIPEYHQDIKNLENFYLNPTRNNFFLAIHQETQKLIGTIGIRPYDRDFPQFRNFYNPKNTASIWRVFVAKPWRRTGVASALVRKAEDFCREKGYQKVYLHTHKTVKGSLDFWVSNGYQITEDTNNSLKTVHMEKDLYRLTSPCDADGILIF